jgi:hypothetical protein
LQRLRGAQPANELGPTIGEQGIRHDQEHIDGILRDGRKRDVDLGAAGSSEHLDLRSNCRCATSLQCAQIKIKYPCSTPVSCVTLNYKFVGN